MTLWLLMVIAHQQVSEHYFHIFKLQLKEECNLIMHISLLVNNTNQNLFIVVFIRSPWGHMHVDPVLIHMYICIYVQAKLSVTFTCICTT